jgi:hypothetical protein
MVLPGTEGITPTAISADGHRLFALAVTSEGPPRTYELRVLDSGSGVLLSAVPLGADVMHAVPAPDETSVWVVSQAPLGSGAESPTWLRQVDMASGGVSLEVQLPGSTLFERVRARIDAIDATASRVAVSLTASAKLLRGALTSAEMRVLDAANGVEVGRVPVEGITASHLDASTGTLLTYSSWHELVLHPCIPGLLHRISMGTGEELSRTPLTTSLCLRAAFAAPPAPPSLASPVVSATRAVTLTWRQSPELTRRSTVEAGSGPGLANLVILPVTDGATLTVPDVPPGTYYVRVRSWNYVGASAPSNEVEVVVRE